VDFSKKLLKDISFFFIPPKFGEIKKNRIMKEMNGAC
jgi:hypothetical protein